MDRLRLAVFDFDGTLCRLNSWHVLLRHILGEGRFASAKVALAFVARRLGLIDSAAFKNAALARFRGWTAAQLSQLGNDLYQRRLRPHLVPAAVSELERCRRFGFEVFVLSGAFDFLLEPFCREHGIERWESTRVAFSSGICLGCLQGEEVRGERKGNVLRNSFSAESVDWPASRAYSDELADLPMFELVGNPFLVNGSRLSLGQHRQIRLLAW